MRSAFTSHVALGALAVLLVTTAVAQIDNEITTPTVVPELPIEIETEVGPAGSLKMIPLWKEIVELLEDPYAMNCSGNHECVATTERRPSFVPLGCSDLPEAENPCIELPPLNLFDPCFNVLTGQPLRMRPDGEIDWNQPGPLFDPDEEVDVLCSEEAFANEECDLIDPTPTELRSVIGALVACPLPPRSPYRFAGPCDEAPEGSLVVSNPNGRGARRNLGFAGTRMDRRIPPHRTVVATAACNAEGELVDEEGMVVDELEQPVNENHFFESRLAAEILGKALFWDMQVGSDGVQACGSCHFHAGVDDRTRNQLNPNTTRVGPNGEPDPDHTLQVAGPNEEVEASDFPFHKRIDPDVVGDGADPAILLSDANDVMSSMGVSEFTRFDDVVLGPAGFGPAFMGVAPLLPDAGTPMPEPVASMVDELGNKLRRVEPRNTPTFHAAAFNFDNFWDGRARHDFNGGSTFGPADPFFHVFVDCRGGLRELAAPAEAEEPLCDWTREGGNYLGADEGENPVPVRIRFSSLASQSLAPALSDTEMAFFGRNWPKIGKKLLQDGVVPLANQLVDIEDSRLGPWSNQGGSMCIALGRPWAVGKPGLCTSYPEMIRAAFKRELWSNRVMHLAGTSVPRNNDCEPGEQIHEEGIGATCDPFDGYVLARARGPAEEDDTNQFTQMEANFSLFFGLSVQSYEQLTIPDDTPFDRFMAANPRAGNGVAQPGEQGTLPPNQIRELVTGSPAGNLTLVPGFGADEVFGFDIFAGGNLTAALPVGPRNPATPAFPLGVGSNPFLRTARCMLCHLGPEQTDHTNNVNAGLLQSGTELEFPTPPTAPEPTGVLRLVTGFALAEELEENAQDGVEVENRNFAILDDPTTPWNDAQIAAASAIAFQDNGIYNIGVRPTREDLLRGGDDSFGWPLSLAALALKNIGGEDFEPCDTETEWLANPASCLLPNFDPSADPDCAPNCAGGGLFETIGEGFPFEGTSYEQESINPGLELEPANPRLPEYLADWVNNLPAGELSPLIDELAFAPNTVTRPPSAEYGEILFGADVHCGVYDPGAFGAGPPNFGWGPRCPNSQTGVPTNYHLPLNGTWPFPNRVARRAAAKVPQLRNVELTGPYFHTGSYLTLRQVIDFYMRGGDFPLTNAEDRDPNLVDVNVQAFGFGTTIGLDPRFQDGFPDAVSQYGPMPDTDHPTTPEPPTSTPEQAKVALVKFLLALTDERVARRAAPFDQPEIFVPMDGRAPANIFGRAGLVGRSGVPCGVGFTGTCFQQVAATGASGQANRLMPFLNLSSTPLAGDGNDHFDRR